MRMNHSSHLPNSPTTLLLSSRVSFVNPPWVELSSTGPAPRHTLCCGNTGSTGSSGGGTTDAAGQEWYLTPGGYRTTRDGAWKLRGLRDDNNITIATSHISPEVKGQVPHTSSECRDGDVIADSAHKEYGKEVASDGRRGREVEREVRE